MTRVEARASRLLRAYPPSYRAEHGDEIIGTLLAASPAGRSWPAPREAWSLVAGGLRARACANRQQPATTSQRLTLLMAAVLWLSWDPYQWLWFLNVSPRGQILGLLGVLLVTATVVASWFMPRSVTVLLAVGTAVALGLAYYHIQQPVSFLYLAPDIVPALVLAGTVAAGPARPPRVWLWLPGGMVTASLLMYAQHMVAATLPSFLIGLAVGTFAFGTLCAAVLWFVVDVRPPIAFLIAYEWLLAPTAVYNG